MFSMDRLKWFLIALVLGLMLCTHAFYPNKVHLSSAVSPTTLQQQQADNLDTFKFITNSQQLRLRLSSVIHDDDVAEPVLFDLIKTWGGDALTLLLAGLIFLVPPLRHQYGSGTFAYLPANYWNPKHLQFRFSHSRN